MRHKPMTEADARVLDEARLDDAGAFQTNGKRANQGKVFDLPFSGEEIYRLILFFEEEAVKAANENAGYSYLRACVLWAEKIRQRARAQGF